MLPKTADVVIIGGGAIGTAIAYYLAARGTKKILLLEREKFLGAGSTSKAAGGVRYQFSTRINIQLSIYSMNVIEHFQDYFGVGCDYRPVGYLFLLTTPQELEQSHRNLQLQKSMGVDSVRWVESNDIHALAPEVNVEGVLGGTFGARDGLADPSSMTQAYANAARQLGAQFETDARVTGIRCEGQRLAAVETERGRVNTRCIVNAAGAWAAEIGRMVRIEIPIAPIRRQLMVTGPMPQFPHNHPFVIEFTTSFYFHPEGQGILFGMSNRDETPGYKFTIDEEFKLKTLERALYRLPLLEHAEIAQEWAGLYEVTPDAHPILCELQQLPGLFIAAGFSGHGVMHSPATGKVMSELILDRRATTVDISSLDLDRFAQGRAIREVNVI